MGIRKIKNVIQRVFSMTWDIDYIQNAIYNQSSGSQKGMNIQPVIKEAYTANRQLPFGSYVKITAGGVYSQVCVGKAYSAAYEHYRRGDIVTTGGFIYVSNQDFQSDIAAGTFDTNRWAKVSAVSIAGIPNAAGDVVCVGKYHNSITVAGFVVDDETAFRKVE